MCARSSGEHADTAACPGSVRGSATSVLLWIGVEYAKTLMLLCVNIVASDTSLPLCGICSNGRTHADLRILQ